MRGGERDYLKVLLRAMDKRKIKIRFQYKKRHIYALFKMAIFIPRRILKKLLEEYFSNRRKRLFRAVYFHSKMNGKKYFPSSNSSECRTRCGWGVCASGTVKCPVTLGFIVPYITST